MRMLLSLIVVACVASPLLAQTPNTLQRDFVSNGVVRMHLSAGAYTISDSKDGKIHIHWSTRDASSLNRVKIRVDVKGTDAKISTDGPDNQDFTVEIQVPRQSDLRIRFTAGDFQIEGIEGNKDIFGYAGNLSVDVGDPASYKEVHASVTTGDIDASAFHVAKGGLFRSFDQKGSGPYTLRVKLRAGDLRLYGSKKEAA
jgi:hypothetical protein